MHSNIMGVVDWLRRGGRAGAVDGATLGRRSIAPVNGEVNPNLLGTAPIGYMEQKYGGMGGGPRTGELMPPRPPYPGRWHPYPLSTSRSGEQSDDFGMFMPEAFDSQDGDGGPAPDFHSDFHSSGAHLDLDRGFSDPGSPVNEPGMQFFQKVGGGRQMIPRVGSAQSISLQDLYNALQDNVQPRQFEALIRRYFNENPWVAEQMFGGNFPEQIDVYAWKKYLESNFGPYAGLEPPGPWRNWLGQARPAHKLPMPGSVNDRNNMDGIDRAQRWSGNPNIWPTWKAGDSGDQMAPSVGVNPQDFTQPPTTLEPGVVPDTAITPTPAVLPGVNPNAEPADWGEAGEQDFGDYTGPLTGDFLKRYQAGPSSVAKFMPWLTDANRHNNLLAAQSVLDKDWLTSGDVGNINPNELKGAIGMGTAQGPSISQLFGSAGGGLGAGSWLERIKKLPWGNADPAGSSMRNIGR